MSNLIRKFEAYSEWRTGVAGALTRYRAWSGQSQLADTASEQNIARLLSKLADDKLSIAFVAEFSRGKSELINAIFFANYGQRILPSSAGRTTMCPTELQYDEALSPSIRLLPIETRAQVLSTSDFKAQSQVWTVLPLDIASSEGMLEAFKQVSLTKRVSIEEATRYGLFDAENPDDSLAVDEQGLVEISLWRHAIVNFPHPLLKQGLVIIDTPGLNAIGTEPELTLNLIPNAHAVLFVLAADTGVTKSDIDVWRNHIGSGSGRMVVLNKIDSMWDELRSPEDIEKQIERQIESVTRTLALPNKQVFPVSAQKGLVAKINHDTDLLARSRLPALEDALANALIPAKKEIIRAQLTADIETMTAEHLAVLSTRTRNVTEQLMELKNLRGKNHRVIEHMMQRIDVEKKEFDESLLKLQGTRAVFARLSMEVFTSLGMEILKEDIRTARDGMQQSNFSLGLRHAVRAFFDRTKDHLALSGQKTEEITEMMTVMYRKFSTEHGLAVSMPMPFSLQKYCDEIDQVEIVYQKQFGTAAIMTTPQVVLMQKFFDSIVSRVKRCFLHANRDVEAWLAVIMTPLETQIREHKSQLKRRLQSIERIHEATDSLEEKVLAIEILQADVQAHKSTFLQLQDALMTALAIETTSLLEAA
ncbi:MAG: dynamin family protein [Burkholderiaceae bacterium]